MCNNIKIEKVNAYLFIALYFNIPALIQKIKEFSPDPIIHWLSIFEQNSLKSATMSHLDRPFLNEEKRDFFKDIKKYPELFNKIQKHLQNYRKHFIIFDIYIYTCVKI